MRNVGALLCANLVARLLFLLNSHANLLSGSVAVLVLVGRLRCKVDNSASNLNSFVETGQKRRALSDQDESAKL